MNICKKREFAQTNSPFLFLFNNYTASSKSILEELNALFLVLTKIFPPLIYASMKSILYLVFFLTLVVIYHLATEKTFLSKHLNNGLIPFEKSLL